MAANSTDDSKQNFIKLLHELFQLDKPELDFGLYRIMHAKSDQLSRFISEDLSKAIEAAFAEQGEQQLAVMRQNIEEKRKQAEELGAPDPDTVPAVKQAQAAYELAKREGSASSDIFDHLYRFFSRYYDKGDFMSRRRHVAENDSRAAPYAVPYDGREVYLHWANKDQYYVKSSETLANFTFNLNEALKKLHGNAAQAGLGFDTVDQALKVHCRVVDATEGEHNDVKESTERFFIIHDAEPVRLEGADLVLQFEYRPDPDKNGQSSTWQKKRLEDAEDAIMQALHATDGVAAYRDGLATPAPTDKQKDRTLLRKYLQQYTARNTMDYFIHKDLGGFLSRELDFYIKNEILRLDDIDDADVLIVEQQLKKIQVLRKIAKQIITFLAQLENFQKKLWLKKKFVTKAEYCFTLDRLTGCEELLRSVFYSENVRKDWENTYSLDSSEIESDLKNSDFLELIEKDKYRFLMVDTGVLGKELKEEVISHVFSSGGSVEGLVVNSDNFHALRLMSKTYEKSVKCTYIDPPYNTGSDSFLYKDGLKSSSWLSMMSTRLESAYPLLANNSIKFTSLDDSEQPSFRAMMDGIFGKENFVASIIWEKNFSPRNTAKYYSENHDYIIAYSKDIEKFNIGLLPRDEAALARYKNPDNDPRGAWTSGDLTARNFYSQGTYEVIGPTGKAFKPTLGSYWRISRDKFDEWNSQGKIWWGENQQNMPRLKRYLSDVKDGVTPTTIWGYRDVGHTQDAKRELTSRVRFSSSGEVFNTVKPERLIKRALVTSGIKDGEWFLDYFAGSGSSGQAVLNYRRDSGVKVNYSLVEVGEYVDNVVIPRIKKSVYSHKWKDNKPVQGEYGEYGGISHSFKYLRLESYDDTLNNLELNDNPQRDALIEKNPELRHDYTLKYMLDVETRGSASLLNTEWFRNPEDYTLKIKQPGSDESLNTSVDLVETFNWLIGLQTPHLDKPRTYVARFERENDPELPEDQNTRLKVVSLRENDDGAYWIRQIEGHVRRIPGSDEDLAKVLVVWRKLTDDSEKDAAVLEALLEKYKIGTTDSEFDAIYINGPHGLNLSGSARGRVHSLEETFHARMWEGCEDGI